MWKITGAPSEAEVRTSSLLAPFSESNQALNVKVNWPTDGEVPANSTRTGTY